MSERLRALAGARPDRWVSLTLLIAFALIALPATPPRAVLVHLFIIGGLLLASARWNVGRLAVVALVLAAVDLRITETRLGSDVLLVTRAAIEHVLAGGNPYGIGYAESVPAGAPYPYGPLALLWYMPPLPARAIELGVAFVITGLLALRGRLLGLAIYAATPVLVHSAGDGSNDTSLGLLLLLGLGALARWPRAGSFVVGLAIAFKPTALAWALPLAGWGGAGALLTLLGGAGLFWLPALLMWGLGPIADSIVGAVTKARPAFYSLAFALERFDLSLPDWLLRATSLAAGAGLAVVSLFRARSVDGVIGWGAAIFLVTLFGGQWSTYAYFAALAPIICWQIDGWLGRAGSRVRWPGDPVGVLHRWLDERWPAVESGTQRRFA